VRSAGGAHSASDISALRAVAGERGVKRAFMEKKEERRRAVFGDGEEAAGALAASTSSERRSGVGGAPML
jgi:hypothetical protein